MKLPNAERAVVRLEKLTEYSLNPAHDKGGHKARVFASASGITIDDAEWLREECLRVAREGEATQTKTSILAPIILLMLSSVAVKGRPLCEPHGSSKRAAIFRD